MPRPPLLVVTMISPLSSLAGPTRHTILLADIHSAVSRQLCPQIDRPDEVQHNVRKVLLLMLHNPFLIIQGFKYSIERYNPYRQIEILQDSKRNKSNHGSPMRSLGPVPRFSPRIVTLVHGVPSLGEIPVTSGGCRARDMAHTIKTRVKMKRKETKKQSKYLLIF